MRDAVAGVLLVPVLVGCSAARFVPAERNDPHRLRTCTGVVKVVAVPAPGSPVELLFELEVGGPDRALLAAGQQHLPCVVLRREDSPLSRLLSKVEVGRRLEVSGYHVLDRRDGRHYLRPLTSIDPYPDGPQGRREPAPSRGDVMTPRLYRVIVPVPDIEAAARFYAAVLGTPGERVSPGRHYFDCGGTILACFDPGADGDEGPARPLPDPLYLAAEDLTSLRERLVTAGGSLASGDVGGDPGGEIARRPWGERSFYAVDPFGNPLCFVEAGTEFTGGRGQRP